MVILVFLATFYFFTNRNKTGVDQTYLLPMNFKGCVVINYDVIKAPPLQIKNNEITYTVPDDGIIDTSSPMEYGWVNKNHSGALRINAFYVDENRKKVKRVPQKEIRFGATGSMQEAGQPEKKYRYQIFGSKEIENQGCPAVMLN